MASRASRLATAKNSKLRIVDKMPQLVDEMERRAAKAAYAATTTLDQYQATNIPIDTSALANNRSITIKKDGARVKAILRFHQNYAAAVNAKVGANWQRPDAIDHWLTVSGEESKDDMLLTISGVMKL